VVPADRTGYGRLDRPTIVDAGLRIAARPGVTEVRFRDLGDELGADPTAVYRHFRSKAHLMAALIDQLMDAVAATLPRDGDLSQLMRTMATSTLDTFTRHPAIGAHLVDARSVGPRELALIEVSLRAFEAAGFSREALLNHYAAFSGLLLSYVAAACRELVTAGTGTLADLPWVPTEVQITPAAFPMLTAYGDDLLGMDFRSVYFAGVEVLIDSTVQAAARG
jgi:AcrR family transcriptional regulator